MDLKTEEKKETRKDIKLCQCYIFALTQRLLQMDMSLYMACLLTKYKGQPSLHILTKKEGWVVFSKYLATASYFSWSVFVPHEIRLFSIFYWVCRLTT